MTPADELLARLESHAESQIEDNLKYIQEADALMREAAALIRTLIAERDEARKDNRGLERHNRALEIENTRLTRTLATAREEGRREGAALNADQAVKEAYEKGRRDMAEEAARIFEGVSHEVEPHIICEAIRQAAQTEGGRR